MILGSNIRIDDKRTVFREYSRALVFRDSGRKGHNKRRQSNIGYVLSNLKVAGSELYGKGVINDRKFGIYSYIRKLKEDFSSLCKETSFKE